MKKGGERVRERRREVRERRKHKNQRNVLKEETIRILMQSRERSGEMERIQPHHEYNHSSLITAWCSAVLSPGCNV